jgi:hypothetical protein
MYDFVAAGNKIYFSYHSHRGMKKEGVREQAQWRSRGVNVGWRKVRLGLFTVMKGRSFLVLHAASPGWE